MKLWTIAVLLVASSSVQASPGNGCGATPPLGRTIFAADVEGDTILSAIYRLAHRNHICLGVVLTDNSLSQPLARKHFGNASAEKVFRALIPRNYGIHEEGLVVVIQPSGPARSWLSQRISRFNLQRADTVRSVVLGSLYMAYEMARDPHRTAGFAGDIHGIDFDNMIGPLDERGKTVRELLNIVAERSRGGMWIALNPRRQRTIPWEFIEYQWPESQAAGQLRWISEPAH